MDVRATGDPRRFLEAAADRLAGDPIRHNVHLTLATALAAADGAGRFWWVDDEGEVLVVAMHLDPGTPVSLGPGEVPSVHALADALAAAAPDIDGVIGPAGAAAAFAGAWATARSTPAHPVEGQRTYRCDEVAAPLRPARGRARPAVATDAPHLVVWCRAFEIETAGTLGGDTAALVQSIIRSATGWVWEVDGEPVAMARATVPAHGVTRVGIVYTSPPHRGSGIAEALVAEVTARQLAGGADTAMLYTQLSNPTSNAIYQRVGYRPVDEIVRYRFG